MAGEGIGRGAGLERGGFVGGGTVFDWDWADASARGDRGLANFRNGYFSADVGCGARWNLCGGSAGAGSGGGATALFFARQRRERGTVSSQGRAAAADGFRAVESAFGV